MSDRPSIILAGYGVADTLQLTIEAQQALTRATSVYAIAPPPSLVRYLRAQRVGVVDLAPRLQAEGVPADAYLDIAGFILREAALDPPVALVVPGNPLFLNSLTRFLVQAAREREVDVSIFPGVSVIDTIVSDLGLDVTSRGLQVYDARHLVGRSVAVNPAVPLLVLQPGGLTAAAAEREVEVAQVHDAFAAHLGRFYPTDHLVTLITRTTGRGQFSHETRALGAFGELVEHLDGSAAIFCDVVRARA